jgi:hypothetical protein
MAQLLSANTDALIATFAQKRPLQLSPTAAKNLNVIIERHALLLVLKIGGKLSGGMIKEIYV